MLVQYANRIGQICEDSWFQYLLVVRRIFFKKKKITFSSKRSRNVIIKVTYSKHTVNRNRKFYEFGYSLFLLVLFCSTFLCIMKHVFLYDSVIFTPGSVSDLFTPLQARTDQIMPFNFLCTTAEQRETDFTLFYT